MQLSSMTVPLAVAARRLRMCRGCNLTTASVAQRILKRRCQNILLLKAHVRCNTQLQASQRRMHHVKNQPLPGCCFRHPRGSLGTAEC